MMNEPRWRMRDTVAIGLLKINPDFFSIKPPQKNPDKEMMLKLSCLMKICIKRWKQSYGELTG